MASDRSESEDEATDVPEWPTPYLDRFSTTYVDFRPDPETIQNDRDHWDRNHRHQGELGRLSMGVQFIGEDGFGAHFESIAREPREILPDTYGGISAAMDACSDYVAFSEVAIEHSPEDVDDAMAVAADPLVAAAALRAWYDRQFAVKSGNMVLTNDHWDAQRRREERKEWKDEGVTFELVERPDEPTECRNCGSVIPEGGTVWTATIAPGRGKEGRCVVCMRGLANSVEDDDWTLNGPDPREYEVDIRGESDAE